VIEARAELDAGELFVTAAWNRQGTGQRTERDAATLPPTFDGGRSRILLRVVPRDSRLTVAIIDHARVLGRGATRGRVEILRVWGDRG
jgi:hypothetical protein